MDEEGKVEGNGEDEEGKIEEKERLGVEKVVVGWENKGKNSLVTTFWVRVLLRLVDGKGERYRLVREGRG